MNILRTPDEAFAEVKDYPFAPNYYTLKNGLRFHYVSEGNNADETVLMMHGEPSWSYLYRKMIPVVVNAGYHVVAPDLIGFGKSDKPESTSDYSYQRHVDWLTEWLIGIDLKNITLVCQDWGGLLGLRLAAENPDRFKRIVAANTGLPTGDHGSTEAFLQWQQYSQTVPVFQVGNIISRAVVNKMSPDTVAAYDAPYPEEKYKAAARIFPTFVPTKADDPSAEANRNAWKVLSKWEKPFLTNFSDSDPVTKGGELVLQKMIPGTKGQKHTIIEKGGHFLQEDKGEEWAQIIVNFIKEN